MERHTRRIGENRCAERDAEVAIFQALPLVKRKAAPPGVVAPELAVVGVDGGRLQILDRTAAARDTARSPDDDTDATSSDGKSRGTHWREDKIGLLLTMHSKAGDVDPCPTVPECFVDPTRIVKLTRELKTKRAAERDDGLAEPRDDSLPDPLCPVVSEPTVATAAADTAPSPAAGTQVPPGAESSVAAAAAAPPALRVYTPPAVADVSDGLPCVSSGQPPCDTPGKDNAADTARYQPPEVQRRSAVATRQPWKLFGPMVAAAAWTAGFFGAARRAFVADGSANNWALWRSHFSSFTPILDFIHVLSYVFAAAMAGRRFVEGWPVYVRWIGWVWAGDVEKVIVEMAQRQVELGLPEKDEGETSPRTVVATALGYLQENKERMRYAEYRKAGLPITSSLVESLVKQFNYRVKGTEKFWSEDGAEGILQLRADALSDGEVLDAFWRRREAGATGQTRHRRFA